MPRFDRSDMVHLSHIALDVFNLGLQSIFEKSGVVAHLNMSGHGCLLVITLNLTHMLESL